MEAKNAGKMKGGYLVGTTLQKLRTLSRAKDPKYGGCLRHSYRCKIYDLRKTKLKILICEIKLLPNQVSSIRRFSDFAHFR